MRRPPKRYAVGPPGMRELPVVRPSAGARLGAPVGAGFLIERLRNDSSHRAQAPAVTAPGEVGATEASAVIGEAAATASLRDVVARAARETMESGQ